MWSPSQNVLIETGEAESDHWLCYIFPQGLSTRFESILQPLVLIIGQTLVLNAVVAACVRDSTRSINPRRKRDAVIRQAGDGDYAPLSALVRQAGMVSQSEGASRHYLPLSPPPVTVTCEPARPPQQLSTMCCGTPSRTGPKQDWP
jgi:hypothetical protein